MRTATLSRTTRETDISVSLTIDGSGTSEIETGVGFFDHMLDQLARHGLFDLTIKATGDRHIDDHHTVEDVGIALGQALKEAIGDKRGITRYASFDLVMDEAYVRSALDVSGRPFLVWNVDFDVEKIGTFDTQLIEEWFRAFAMNAGITLHVDKIRGDNAHHIAEAAFKALARALRAALTVDPREADRVPSTKGTL
ncbi:MAG: imidazoleglycerol-phosphate dehydratase HisB [Pseudomonadota bacterium]